MMAKTLLGLVKYKNGKMHFTESRTSGHSDTNLDALPAKCSFVCSKTSSYSFYDERGDEMFVLSDSEEEGVSHSQ